MKRFELDVVIVTHNSASLICKCLDSFYNKFQNSTHKIYLVDNASSDNICQIIKGKYKDVELIERKENLGYAKAINIALELSKSPNILLLNPDTIILDNAETMISFLDNNKADIIGPRLLNEDGSLQRWAGGYFPTLMRAFIHYFFISNVFKTTRFTRGIYLSSRDKKMLEVDWVSGAFLMFKREIIEKVGLLKEEYFMYAEDMEFCYRARKKGFKVIYLPAVKVMHLNKKVLGRKYPKLISSH